jgi:hypothetical protein
MQHQYNALVRAFPKHAFEQKTEGNIFYLLTEVQNNDCYIWKEPGYLCLTFKKKGSPTPEFEMLRFGSPLCTFTTLFDLVAFLKALL